MSEQKISCTIICKNEEDVIERCISSVINSVFEVIVVDTGSTDKTVEIIKDKFPEVKLHHFKWCNDFAKARNFAVSKTKGNWIFYMDADEVFNGKFPLDIEPAIYNFKIKNLSDDGSFVYSNCSRLAPKHKDLFFQNPVHEIWCDSKQKYKITIFKHAEIIHYGYLSEYRQKKNKSKRNLEMLELDYKDGSTVQKCYYLAQELFIVGEKERAFKLIEEGMTLLDLSKGLDATFEPLVYHLYIALIMELKKYELIPMFEEKYLYKASHPECFVTLQQYYLNEKDDEKMALKYAFEALKLRNLTVFPAKYNQNAVTYMPLMIMAAHCGKKGDNLGELLWLELAHMNGITAKEVIAKIYELLPKYVDPSKCEYYLGILLEQTKDKNVIKEMANIFLNSNNQQKERRGYEIVRDTSDIAAFEVFKQKLLANKKEYLVGEYDKGISEISLEKFKGNDVDAITVIIPTILKANQSYLQYIISVTIYNKLVEKVIIVDNTNGEFLKNYPKHEKIKVIEIPNVGVNKAFNLAMQFVDTPYYVLLNDDCLVRDSIYTSCYNAMENGDNIGMIAVNTLKEDLKKYGSTNPSDEKDIFVTFNSVGLENSPQAWFMCGRTEDWVDIPTADDMKFFYGDNFIHLNIYKKGRNIVKLVSDYVSHEISSSIVQMGIYEKGYLESERKIYIEEIEKLGWKP